MFSKTCEPRHSLFPNHQDQQLASMVCTYPQLNAQAPHRRATPEPINDYYRHKALPRLPCEIDPYRSRSLPELPSQTSKPIDKPLSKHAPEVPPYKDTSLPSLPLRTKGLAKREVSSMETNGVVDLESSFPYWSKSLLLKCENGGSWEEKLAFARETQDCWTKGILFAHELRDCAYGCACGMI